MADTTTTESIVRQAPFLEDFQRQLLTGAFGTEGDASSGLQPADIPAIQVAGLQPLQQAAIQRGQAGIGVQNPFIQAGGQTLGASLGTLQAGLSPLQQGVTTGLGSIGQFAPDQIAPFLDPFQAGATDVGLQELARQADIRRTLLMLRLSAKVRLVERDSSLLSLNLTVTCLSRNEGCCKLIYHVTSHRPLGRHNQLLKTSNAGSKDLPQRWVIWAKALEE